MSAGEWRPDASEEARIEQVNAQMDAIRGSAFAADGSLSIETDLTGRITSLWIAEWAMDQHGPGALARLLRERHSAALRDARQTAENTFEGVRGV
ncbi:hypothetical protein GCM10011591_21810 [Nocardia camponoti]|uniref:YbaB/EbfC family DNA-binding protein n=2 Tax=Nocardia camponoti TaxID=1616106 RepID=A0A917V8D3_9NOCA|nr:hypothetical protein GCM10011591_21810 [Nocardia camponoti]